MDTNTIKETRRNEIINVAQQLFITKGLAETTMTDIATEIGISRRTLYRYYKTKEELAFEIEIRLFEDFFNFQNNIFQRLTGNGLTKLQEFFKNIETYIKSNANIIRFSGEFDHYFRGEYPYLDLVIRFKEVVTGNDVIEKLIAEGINDGPVRNEINPKLTALTINNVIISIAQRVIIREAHLSEEQGIDAKEMITEQFRLFVLALTNSI